jgi:glycosyltransferase involved in cell wall biosynthesis
MRLAYVSPSVLPSASANSVHVVHQCEAFARAGVDVLLYAKRSIRDPGNALAAVRERYGVDFRGVTLRTYFSTLTVGDNLRIASRALAQLALDRPDVILCRNLYAAYVIAVLWRRSIVYETHHLELGARRWLQRAIVLRPGVLTVVISEQLRQLLAEHVGAAPARTLVLHDAAADGIVPLAWGERRKALQELLPAVDLRRWRGICAYFGNFYPGRGVEVIEEMARRRPEVLFLLFGERRTADAGSGERDNLMYPGFLPHPRAIQVMKAVDVLLMPYQLNVSIGLKGHDTARWMSPMKMFEYLASGTPIVSSDLTVLREVLRDGDNALLVPPADVGRWIAAMDSLLAEPALARRLGEAGHAAYASGHTWSARARRILESIR